MQNDKTARTQIKEMAKQLGVSQSTVSVVLSGRGDELRISKATQRRVLEYAKEIGYQPNIYARRLRHATDEEPVYVIALFWREDNLNSRLGKFIQGIQNAIERKSCRAELVVQPYRPGSLLKYREMFSPNRISAAMVCGLLEEDQTGLEELDVQVPIVLIGRESGKYHSIQMDSYLAGEACAAKLCGADAKEQERNGENCADEEKSTEGKRCASVSSAAFIGFANAGSSERRMEAGFRMGCREHGVTVAEESILYLPNSSHENGYEAAGTLLDRVELPSAWLVGDSRLAGGIFDCCEERGVRVPEDLRLIFFEDSGILKYHKPSLSAVDVPTMEMAEKALELLLCACENTLDMPLQRQVSPLYFFRESSECSGKAERL